MDHPEKSPYECSDFRTSFDPSQAFYEFFSFSIHIREDISKIMNSVIGMSESICETHIIKLSNYIAVIFSSR